MVSHLRAMAEMQSLEKPLTKEELGKLEELLHSDRLFERMVEKAVRGRRKAERRGRKPRRPP